MNIIYFGNNRLGWQILQWLRERKENIVALVLHPSAKRKYGEEIESLSCGVEVIDGSELGSSEATLDLIRSFHPDIGVSILFGYILHQAMLDLFPKGVINLHPALLPYNRGAMPNVWSIVDGTPAGATLHYVDKGIDTGDIIASRKVSVLPTDTGESLYRVLECNAAELFKETWPLIRQGRAPRVPQVGISTYHRSRDVDAIDEIDLGRTYRARDLINVLRARTFPPYKGAYFRRPDGRRIFMSLDLRDDEL